MPRAFHVPGRTGSAPDVAAGTGPTSKVANLRAIRLFDALDDQALHRAADLGDEVAVPAGYVLVYEGDWRDEVFVLCDGTAAVIVDGHAQLLLGPGSVIGAVPPLAPPTRAARVVAATPTRFFVFERKAFAELGMHQPHFNGNGSTRPPGRRQADRPT